MIVNIVLGVWFVVMPCAMIVILWRILQVCQEISARILAFRHDYHAFNVKPPEPERHKMPSVPHDPKRDKELRRQYRERIRLAKEAEK